MVFDNDLGHHIHKHYDIPLGYILWPQQQRNPKLALKLFAWPANPESRSRLPASA